MTMATALDEAAPRPTSTRQPGRTAHTAGGARRTRPRKKAVSRAARAIMSSLKQMTSRVRAEQSVAEVADPVGRWAAVAWGRRTYATSASETPTTMGQQTGDGREAAGVVDALRSSHPRVPAAARGAGSSWNWAGLRRRYPRRAADGQRQGRRPGRGRRWPIRDASCPVLASEGRSRDGLPPRGPKGVGEAERCDPVGKIRRKRKQRDPACLHRRGR